MKVNSTDVYGEDRDACLPALFDGHNDALLRLHRLADPDAAVDGFLTGTGGGQLDLPRARQAGLRGGLFAIHPPSPAAAIGAPVPTPTGWEVAPIAELGPGEAARATTAMLELAAALERRSDGAVRIVRSAREMATVLTAPALDLVLHVEGAEALDGDPGRIAALHAAGVRSIGPVWSRPNAFGHGVPFGFGASPDVGPGLTAAGQALVRRCDALGILVDLAHLNLRGFYDVATASARPLVVSHAAAHAVSPSRRNLLDEQLDLIAATGGLVGLTFHAPDVRPDGRDDPGGPLEDLVRQVDYLVQRMGVEHVALGSDFDGASIPHAIGDVLGLPRLLRALSGRGYSTADLERLAGGNWIRVLRRALMTTSKGDQ